MRGVQQQGARRAAAAGAGELLYALTFCRCRIDVCIFLACRHAYVGCYTGFTEKGVLGWVGTPNAGLGITHFLLDEATGKLTSTGEVTEQDSPAWLEPSPCGKFLIATHELSHHTGVPVGTGFLTSYAVDAETGALTKICTTSTGGHGNTCCSFDRTGKFLLVTRCKTK